MKMFDDIIKQKADGHQAPVPPDAWDNIVKKKRRRRPGFFWWITGILMLSGLGTASYFGMQHTQKHTVTATTETALIIKDKSHANQNQRTTTEGTNSGAAKTAADNSRVPDQKTILPTETNAAAKIKPGGQTAVLPSHSVVSSTQADVVVANSDKGTAGKDNKLSSLAGNGRQLKKVRGKATTQINGSATEEENEKQQLQKTVPGNAVVTTNEPAQQSDITIAEKQKPVPASNLPVKDSAVEAAAKKQEPVIASVSIKKQSGPAGKKSNKKSWYLDIAVTPVLPIQQYDNAASFNRTLSTPTSLSSFSGKLISTSIDPAVAFSLAIKKSISAKSSVGMGLQYLQLKENIDLSGTETTIHYDVVNRRADGTNGPVLINDTIQTVTEGTRKVTATNNYTFYSIPIFIQYNLIQKRNWSAGLTAGLFVNIFSQYKNEINQNGSAALTTTPQISSTNSMGLDIYAGLRFGKMLGKKLEFFALPSMRWNLKAYNIKNSLVNKKIQQAGVSFGLSFKIK